MKKRKFISQPNFNLFKRSKSINLQWVLPMLLLIFYSHNLLSQERFTTVLLPSKVTQKGSNVTNSDPRYFEISAALVEYKREKTGYVQLEFDLSKIPARARVESWEIRIYLAEMNGPQQAVQMYLLPDTEKSVNQTLFNSENTTLNNEGKSLQVTIDDVQKRERWLSDQKNVLKVQLDSKAENFKYYTTMTGSSDALINYQPKLIINYYMPLMMAEDNWSQHKNNPQHTGQSLWKANVQPTDLKYTEVVYKTRANSFIKSKLVIYKQQLVFHYQRDSVPQYNIRAIAANGTMTMPAKDKDIGGVVNFQPVIDHSGRLYCIVANSMLKILDLENNLNIIHTEQLGNNVQVTDTPVLGYDGSLYLSTNQGIYAYTPYPQLKLKWKYSSKGNYFGTVALSEDEKTVYVINGGIGKLLAIDNIDGTKKWESGNFLEYTVKDRKGRIPIPVPSVKDKWIITLDGVQEGNRFSIIDSAGKIIEVTPPLEPSKGEVFSEPVIGSIEKEDSYYAYIINNGALEAYNLKTGARVKRSKALGLNPASALVMEANDNVYVLNNEQNNQSIAVFNKECFAIVEPKKLEGIENLADEHLVLAPDGNLYTDSSSKLYSIRPMSNQDELELQNLENQMVYRGALKIIVNGSASVNAETNTIIYAANKISFKTGFKVKKGAKLTCKTGY